MVANFADRKETIRTHLLAQADGDQVVMPESLLDEVTSLVEWPVVYACRFEDEFLQVPQECLILTMQTNQKYFALTDANGKLRSRFLIVSNIETKTPGDIVEGNERVVRPRLADAKFFFEQDKKKPLADRVPLLANVVYHNKLGSALQRVERLEALAGAIAPLIGADVALAKRAARLAKADLITDMVGEFPELQGTMGTYYARHDGEPEEVALACSEHYQPRFSGDALPATATGTVVALADKLETLVGIWGIGLQPTGEKDPFALRRHALGVLRILIEKQLPVDLVDLLRAAYAQFAAVPDVADSTQALYDFHHGPPARPAARARLRAGRNRRGAGPEPDAPRRHRRAARRRARIRGAAGSGVARGGQQAHLEHPEEVAKAPRTGGVQVTLLIEAAEKALHAQLEQVAPRVQSQLAAARLHGRAVGARRVARTGRHVLQRRDGQRRRPGVARQPAGLARRAASADELRRRHFPTRRLSPAPCRPKKWSSSTATA